MNEKELRVFNFGGWMFFILIASIGAIGASNNYDYDSSFAWLILVVMFCLSAIVFDHAMFPRKVKRK